MPENIWSVIRAEVGDTVESEPILAHFLYASVLEHASLQESLSFHLANILNSETLPTIAIREVISEVFALKPDLIQDVARDICAFKERDPVCQAYAYPLLYFKGFHALQSYRVAHSLWEQGRHALAIFFQNRISTVLAVDIHPAASIGSGLLIDHATGIVVGETAVIEDDVSILHSVTLGGTGKECGDRHPKIGQGVLISAGAKILGNVRVGEGAKVGAGSVVLSDVPAHTTVAGIPAKVIGQPKENQPALAMNHSL